MALPHDATRFVSDHETALDGAQTSLDLRGVLDVERWRRIAILETDPDTYRRTMRLAAELATGEPSPDDEPLDGTTTRAGLKRVFAVETVGESLVPPGPGSPTHGMRHRDRPNDGFGR